jgi:two-component system, cell cycle sensor histidine kinase and response regulator CckA
MARQTAPRAADYDRYVLIVDDDRDFADSLSNLLRLDGYKVNVAYNATAALEALEHFSIEVALIDLRMDDEDGLALVSEFRRRREDVIYVIITAYASVESAIQALQRGAYDFLCKPFYPEVLIATLDRCFEKISLTRGREAAERDLCARNRELEAVNARLKRAVAAMQVLSSSTTLPALYTTAIETFAHVMVVENVGLYLAENSDLILYEALQSGLPWRLQLPDARTFRRSTFAIQPSPLQDGLEAASSFSASPSSRPSFIAFPLTSERSEPLGLLVLQPNSNVDFGHQDRELGVILAAFVNEAIRLLRALDSVRWSEARLREIIDNSPSSICLTDRQGRYLVVNRQFEIWHGQGAREVLGMTPRDAFLSSDLARLYEGLETNALDENKIVEEEAEVVFKDGLLHTILATRFPIRDASGRSIGTGTVATDVTERRHAQERLRHSQQMEALGQLTGGIAHDFNNLLAVIIGNLDLLRDKFSDLYANAAGRSLIDDSLSSAFSGRDLVQRLLAFGRRQRLHPEPTDANKLVFGLSRVIERALNENIQINWALGSDLWPITVDKSQFETSLLNLVFNSRDAMPNGGLLSIETSNVVLRHPLQGHETISPGTYVTLTVTDGGTGMPPDVVAQALQPFFTTKDPGNGSGLGLSMVYGFVKQSGGHLSIHSAPVNGTSVTLYFPKAKDPVAHPNETVEHRVDDFLSTERILVVEDQKMVRKMVTTVLTELGYRVFEAEDASKALFQLQQGPKVNLLLTDIVLTGDLDGIGLAKKARQTYPELKVLFMSGYAEVARSRNAELGVGRFFIEKPFTKEDLAHKLQLVLADNS